MDLQLIKHHDHYVVKNASAYFKLGLFEGDVLAAIRDEIPPEEIQQRFQISATTYNALYEQFLHRGVIGKPPAEKFNIFWMKFALFNPDRLLEHMVKFFVNNRGVTKTLLWCMNLFIVSTLWLFFYNLEPVVGTALSTFSITQLALCYVSMFFCIVLHEFGHGFACKYYGGRVSKMGFMLIFFSPALYCDVSDAWMFKKKRHRVYVSFAGLYVQALLMGGFTVLWSLFPTASFSGYLSWMIFTNLMVIISNSIPFLKLDGYWILTHAVGIPNLFKKSLHSVLGLCFKKMRPQTTSKTQNLFLLLYGMTTVFMAAVFAYLGLHGLYLFSTYESINIAFRIPVIMLESFIYLYFLWMIYQSITNAVRKKQ